MKKKVLISGLVEIGDYILLRCFIKSMRQSERYADIHLTLLGNVAYRDFSLKYDASLYDNFIWVDCAHLLSYAELSSRFGYTKHFWKKFLLKRKIKFEKFDEIIMPDWWSASTNLRVMPLVKHCQQSYKVAYALRFEHYQKYLPFFDEIIRDEIDYGKHVLQINQDFFTHLCGKAEIDFDLSMLKKSPPINSQEKGIAISLSSTAQFRKWSPINYVKVITHLHETFSCRFYLLGGKNEIHDALLIMSLLDKKINISNTVGQIPLDETTQLIANADLLISNDTGLYHIGIMSNTESICISNIHGAYAFIPYPKTITNKCHLIVPENLQNKIGTPEHIAEKQWNPSDLNIDLIHHTRVIEAAKEILLQKNEYFR